MLFPLPHPPFWLWTLFACGGARSLYFLSNAFTSASQGLHGDSKAHSPLFMTILGNPYAYNAVWTAARNDTRPIFLRFTVVRRTNAAGINERREQLRQAFPSK